MEQRYSGRQKDCRRPIRTVQRELQMTDDIVRLMAERLNQNYRPKTNYTNNRQNNKRRY